GSLFLPLSHFFHSDCVSLSPPLPISHFFHSDLVSLSLSSSLLPSINSLSVSLPLPLSLSLSLFPSPVTQDQSINSACGSVAMTTKLDARAPGSYFWSRAVMSSLSFSLSFSLTFSLAFFL